MPNSWTLNAKAEIAPGRASLPEDWFEEAGHEDTTYVRVTDTDGKRPLTLLAQPRAGAKGRQIHVAPGTFGLGAAGATEVRAVPLSVRALKRQRAKEAVTGFGLAGLVLAVVGLAMQGFLSFNQHDVVFNSSDLTIALMSAFSPLMQILGAILVFIKSTVFGTTPGT